jgi:hypothetical protein
LKKYLILSCFLIGMTCQAQVKNFSFHISANCPIINDVETDHQAMVPIAAATGYSSYFVTAGVRESFKSKVGFEVGSRFDYPINSKFFVTSGLSFSYIQFQRTVEISHLSSGIQFHNLPVPTTVGEPFGAIHGSFRWQDVQGNVVLNPPSLPQRSEDIGNTATLSLQAPVLVGTSFFNKKLEVRTGALLSYLLHATQTKEKYEASTQSIADYKDSSKAGFSEFQAGIALQSTYLVSRKIGIDFTAQKFFTPIYKSNEQFGGEAKYNVLTLGLSYHL